MSSNRLKEWKNELQYDKKESTLTTEDRIQLIMQFLEDLSTQSCFYYHRSERKKCQCLSFLGGNDSAKRAIANYIMDWVDNGLSKMILINEIRVAKEMENFKVLHTGCPKRKEAMENFYHIYFIAISDDQDTNDLLSNTRICQNAFAAVFVMLKGHSKLL